MPVSQDSWPRVGTAQQRLTSRLPALVEILPKPFDPNLVNLQVQLPTCRELRALKNGQLTPEYKKSQDKSLSSADEHHGDGGDGEETDTVPRDALACYPAQCEV